MEIPRATPDRIAYAQFATRGVLTRLAMMFDANRDAMFTGEAVRDVILQVVASVGRPGEKENPCSLTSGLGDRERLEGCQGEKVSDAG